MKPIIINIDPDKEVLVIVRDNDQTLLRMKSATLWNLAALQNAETMAYAACSGRDAVEDIDNVAAKHIWDAVNRAKALCIEAVTHSLMCDARDLTQSTDDHDDSAEQAGEAA